MSQDISNYIEQLNDLPPEILLGRIVFFSIHEHPIMLSDVTRWFSELQLNPAFLPKPNRRVDAFKKATKEMDKVKYPMSRGRTGILMCREVTDDASIITRQITREIKDKDRGRLSYIEAIKCVFYRGGEQFQHPVNIQALEAEEVDVVKGFARRMQERYNYHADYMDSAKTRMMVRNYLKYLNSVNLGAGGVYYVNCTKDQELHQLAELVNRLGGGCHMNLIPIVNIKREREFLSRMFEQEAAKELNEVTKEIEDLLQNRATITPKAYAKMKGRYAEVMEKAAEHFTTLEINQAVTEAHEELARNALAKMEQRLILDGGS